MTSKLSPPGKQPSDRDTAYFNRSDEKIMSKGSDIGFSPEKQGSDQEISEQNLNL